MLTRRGFLAFLLEKSEGVFYANSNIPSSECFLFCFAEYEISQAFLGFRFLMSLLWRTESCVADSFVVFHSKAGCNSNASCFVWQERLWFVLVPPAMLFLLHHLEYALVLYRASVYVTMVLARFQNLYTCRSLLYQD